MKHTFPAFSYTFSSEESEALSQFFFKHENEMPITLSNFFRTIKKISYDSLSLDEAKQFYS